MILEIIYLPDLKYLVDFTICRTKLELPRMAQKELHGLVLKLNWTFCDAQNISHNFTSLCLVIHGILSAWVSGMVISLSLPLPPFLPPSILFSLLLSRFSLPLFLPPSVSPSLSSSLPPSFSFFLSFSLSVYTVLMSRTTSHHTWQSWLHN